MRPGADFPSDATAYNLHGQLVRRDGDGDARHETQFHKYRELCQFRDTNGGHDHKCGEFDGSISDIVHSAYRWSWNDSHTVIPGIDLCGNYSGGIDLSGNNGCTHVHDGMIDLVQ